MRFQITCALAAALIATTLTAPILLDDDTAPVLLDDDLSDERVDQCGKDQYWANEEKFRGCRDCPIGSTSPAGTIAIYDCKCPQNTYLDQSKSGSCKKCPQGTPLSLAGSVGYFTCSDKCPINTYLDGKSCIACAPGALSPAGSTSSSACVPCPKNTYRNVNGDSCTKCPLLKTSPAGSPNVDACKPK